ncbi:MAG: ATP-binding protein [Bacteroides sp.]|jgi:MinD superfamily P-loop ATPase|nr:ATP-binding protein [Bacteroides sp.]
MTDHKPLKIAIASGKGGTGKTLVATNLFHTLISNDIKTSLVDCDAEAPNAKLFFEGKLEKSFAVTQQVPVIDENLCTYCGKCYEYCHYNAIFILPPARVIKVIEDLCHGCGACTVACKFGAITEKPMPLGEVRRYALEGSQSLVESCMKTGVFSPVAVIKAGIKEAGNGQTVIMDAPPGTSCPFIQTVDRADFVVLVTEPTPFGLSDLRQSVETLKRMKKPCGVIVNRTGLGNHALYDFLEQEDIPLLMEIPFERNIAHTYAQGRKLKDLDPAWETRFLNLFEKIILENGNSHHKR